MTLLAIDDRTRRLLRDRLRVLPADGEAAIGVLTQATAKSANAAVTTINFRTLFIEPPETFILDATGVEKFTALPNRETRAIGRIYSSPWMYGTVTAFPVGPACTISLGLHRAC